MLLDYLVAGFVVLTLGTFLMVVLHHTLEFIWFAMFPRGLKTDLRRSYNGLARLVRKFYRWLYLKDWDYSPARQNRKLSPQEIMEREALRRGICPDCGVDAKKAGGLTALGGPCPYHTDF